MSGKNITRRPTDLTGEKFGRLTVIGLATARTFPSGRSRKMWTVVCSCGSPNKEVGDIELRSGRVRSCSCLLAEGGGNLRKHGKSGTPTHQIWCGMIRRCTDPSAKTWKYYGGRGIRVCERWLTSFENFLVDMGPRPSQDHQIDRHPNNNGNYEPWNCRWATRLQNMKNTRRSRLLSDGIRTMNLIEWARELSMSPGTILERIANGWSVRAAITTGPLPVGTHRPNH
jgi:hypothetical protein